MNTDRSWPGLRAKTLTLALTLACAHAAFAASPLATKPDALLQIDLNRTSVVEKIVSAWEKEIPAAQIGSFRSKLSALRADQLLAANLSGSFDGVLEVMNSHEAAQKTLLAQSASVNSKLNGAERSKALGDIAADLVYTPIAPCRILDTRSAAAGGIPNPMSGNQLFTFKSHSATGFAPFGGSATDCALPTGGEVRGLVANISVLQQPGLPNFSAYIAIAEPTTLSSLLANATLSFNANQAAGSASVIKTNATGNLNIAMPAQLLANVIIEATGYFKAPGGIIGDITDIQTAAGSGLTGGSASGVASLSLAPSFKLPQSCAANQIPKWDGAVWTCAADATGAAATNAWTQGGNAFGAPGVLGTTDTQPMTVQGSGSVSVLLSGTTDGLRVLAAPAGAAFQRPNIILGDNTNALGNTTGAQMLGMTISGGAFNTVGSADGLAGGFATVGGGNSNRAINANATVGGGYVNIASGTEATVAGGQANTASANNATVGGGISNVARGDSSVVPGGRANTAGGLTSFAAGNQAKAIHDGAFVWGDSTPAEVSSTAANQFVVRAGGGVQLVEGTTLNFGQTVQQMLNLYGTQYGFGVQNGTLYSRTNGLFAWYLDGVHNAATANSGGGSTLMLLRSVAAATPAAAGHVYAQTFNPSSDRNVKAAIRAVNPKAVLDKVLGLPISSWSYKTDASARHIGPMAQDFRKAFGLGGASGDTTIATVDADGVALAAIQGLAAVVKEKEAKIVVQAEKLSALEREMAAIKRKLGL
jgi:trimeric autotransporter adhesin